VARCVCRGVGGRSGEFESESEMVKDLSIQED
jgi:hypothetical protein